jgi:hypothetical protein
MANGSARAVRATVAVDEVNRNRDVARAQHAREGRTSLGVGAAELAEDLGPANKRGSVRVQRLLFEIPDVDFDGGR